MLGGAHGSLEIARSLGRRGIPVWLITDDNPLPTLSRYVERSFYWPRARDEGRLAFLLELADRERLDRWVLFAGADDEVRFVAQNRQALEAVFVVTTPGWDAIRWANDKRRMNARAVELDIAQPRTRYPRSPDDLAELGIDFPVILKPTVRNGRNAFLSAKAWRADNERQLAARYARAQSLVGADSIMVQEFIPGDGSTQFSYAGVWDRGAPVASLVARRRRQYPIEFGFTSTFVETTSVTEVEDAAIRFLKTLDYHGLVEIEFKYDTRDRRYKILDVNARAWTWIALGAKAGMDFPYIQWRLAHGEQISPVCANLGVRWLYFSRDLAAALGEMLTGRLSPIAYLRTLPWSSASAVFAPDDPWPAALDLPLVASRVAMRRLSRRDRDADAALQSARVQP